MRFLLHLSGLVAPVILMIVGIPELFELSSVEAIAVESVAQTPTANTTSDTEPDTTLRQEGMRIFYSGQPRAAIEKLEAALKAARDAGDQAEVAATLSVLSRANDNLGNQQEALALAEEALSVSKASNNSYGEAEALRVLAYARYNDAPDATVLEAANQALEIAKREGLK